MAIGYVDATTGEASAPHAMAAGRTMCPLVQSVPTGDRMCRHHAALCLSQLTSAAIGGLDRRWVVVPCHAGLRELAAPIVVDGHILGALLLGGYVAPDVDGVVEAAATQLALAPGAWRPALATTPTLTAAEAAVLGDAVAEVAKDVAAVVREHLTRGGNGENGEAVTRAGFDGLIGRASPMQSLYALLERVARSDSTVLIQGENGTGKELAARAIHQGSTRNNRRFVVTNCSAFNDNLLDSELFGHKRGAFTGAVVDKPGLFEIADTGTFFLDEIGDMSPTLQVKVLRVLQEGTFNRVGDTETRKVDVRIIAATNRDLRTMVDRGQFREDLYYRINVINVVMPALRDRRDDIPVLIEFFLDKHRRASRGRAKRLSDECVARLIAYPWPGNVRELENEIERVVVLSGDDPVVEEDLLSPRIRSWAALPEQVTPETPSSLPEAVEALERRMIVDALRRHRGNKTRASADLKVSRRNLIRLVQKYGLDSER